MPKPKKPQDDPKERRPRGDISRWTDDPLIEDTPEARQRAREIAFAVQHFHATGDRGPAQRIGIFPPDKQDDAAEEEEQTT